MRCSHLSRFSDNLLFLTPSIFSPLLIDSSTELELFLHENDDAEKANVDEKWGKVVVSVKLNPKSQEEKEHVRFFLWREIHFTVASFTLMTNKKSLVIIFFSPLYNPNTVLRTRKVGHQLWRRRTEQEGAHTGVRQCGQCDADQGE